MSKKRRKSGQRVQQQELAKTNWRKELWGYIVAFSLGAVIAVFAGMLIVTDGDNANRLHLSNKDTDVPSPTAVGQRTVAQLIALSDAELEHADIVEMNIAVARELSGLEKLDYDKYRRIVDGWAEQFRAWLPTVEHAFHQAPSKYRNDINFFRLGMLAQFLDQHVGIAYVKEHSDFLKKVRESGKKAQVLYTDPGHLLLHGLVDTKEGTCATMPTLHVAIGRRLGWPVALACTSSHYVCRYDDGKVHYNIEATDTGHGGFAVGTDDRYIKQYHIPRRAIAVGSDLRKLTGREMLGVFIQSRARHLQDVNKTDFAARDYALAHVLFPRSRKVYIGLMGNLLSVGDKLFVRNEHGHPKSLGVYLSRLYASKEDDPGFAGGSTRQPDPLAELARIEALNRQSRLQRQRLAQPPTPSTANPYQPGRPGIAQPHQYHNGYPNQPRR